MPTKTPVPEEAVIEVPPVTPVTPTVAPTDAPVLGDPKVLYDALVAEAVKVGVDKDRQNVSKKQAFYRGALAVLARAVEGK